MPIEVRVELLKFFVDANRSYSLLSMCYNSRNSVYLTLLYLLVLLAPLKNAIDWASRPPNVWADKPAAIVSAGGGFGGGRAQYHLRQIGVYLDLHFINKPEFFVNAFQPPLKFDSQGNLTDPEAKKKLTDVLLALQTFTLRLQGKCSD